MSNLCSETMMRRSGDGNNESYIEIILDIFHDSVAIRSIQGEAVLEDPELCSMVKKTLENGPSSTSSLAGFTLFGKTCSQIKKLKHQIASLGKRPSAFKRFDQAKSAAAAARTRFFLP